MEKFSQNLCASKKLWYNERNCKLGRHSQQHTFVHRKSQNKNTSTYIPNLGLEVKGRNKGETKLFSPCRRDRMLCALHHRQNNNFQEPTNISQPFLCYNEPDLCNDYIFKKPGYGDRFCISFPCHCILGYVLLNTNSLDNVSS